MQDVLNIWTTAGEHYHDLWVLYVAVAFGVFGFTFTDAYVQAPVWAKLILTLAFVGFAVTNAISLADTSDIGSRAVELLRQSWRGTGRDALLDSMVSTSRGTIYVIEACAGTAVVVASSAKR